MGNRWGTTPLRHQRNNRNEITTGLMTLSDNSRNHFGSLRKFFTSPFFTSPVTIGILWIIFAIVATITKGGIDGTKCNNFIIFRQVFYHLIDQNSLYAYYPEEYYDHNLYGPLFSVIIAPFALLPKFPALILWNLFLGAGLFLTLLKLPIGKTARAGFLWIVSNEVLCAMQMAQFNIAIAALVVGTYLAIRNENECVAALCLVVGTLTKLYGIVGIVFFLFSRHKLKSIGWIIFWTFICLILPMFISSPEFVLDQYREWVTTILDKNDLNVQLGTSNESNIFQNISAIGMTHRITGAEFSDLWILIPGVFLFMLPFCRTALWKSHSFQWGIVASGLMCIILFSTGSESSGYIIAMTGVAIWYIIDPSKRDRTDTILLIAAIILSSFGTSDLMPKILRNELIRPYSLKALPILTIWLCLTWQLCRLKADKLHSSRYYENGKIAEMENFD